MSATHNWVMGPGNVSVGLLDRKPWMALTGEKGWAGWVEEVGPDETSSQPPISCCTSNMLELSSLWRFLLGSNTSADEPGEIL